MGGWPVWYDTIRYSTVLTIYDTIQYFINTFINFPNWGFQNGLKSVLNYVLEIVKFNSYTRIQEFRETHCDFASL